MRGGVRHIHLICRDAVIAAVACSAFGLVFNAVRPGGIPLFAEREYELFVPCPEPLGEVEPIAPTDLRSGERGAVLIDARAPEEFARWHMPGARNVPFDYIEGVPEETVRSLASAARLIVYGDGDDPDSGRELARELAGRGLRNVFYVRGGAPALQSSEQGHGSDAGVGR